MTHGAAKLADRTELRRRSDASHAGDSAEHLFDRATVTIAANVADATHGETVTEVLGSGDGSQPNQSFKLKQAPALTYMRSTAPGGAESTLQIRVNDLLWHEVPTLFEREPRERIFTTEAGG